MQHRIKAIRIHFGLNQTEFGCRLGAKQSTVAGWENSGRIPPGPVISLMCKEFGVSETWLRTGEGEMYVLPDAQQKLVNFCTDVLSGVSGPVRRQFVELLASLDDRQLEVAAEIMDWIVENWKKENDTEK